MFTKEHQAYQYTDKSQVLWHLTQLIDKELLPQEQQLIYLHCGIENEKPMQFSELAKHFKINSVEITEQCYNDAVQKTRAAIPGSKLDYWIVGYNPR